MDSNIALAGLASGMAGLIGAECCRGVHDTPPGCAWKHCHEKYVWTPVFFTTSPHHGLLQSYPIRTAVSGRHLWAWHREPGLGQADARAVENEGRWGHSGLTVGGGVAAQAWPVGSGQGL